MNNKSKASNKKQNGSKNKWLILASVAIVAVLLLIAVSALRGTPDNTAASAPAGGTDLKLVKSEITEKAKFYPYKAGETYMEVIAVKASDGSIRTALNTCQVCYDSGRGYYVQQGDTLVCQNCGNVFGIDDIEKVKNGCNPVPILKENKTESASDITISKDFLASNAEYFLKWKR